MTTNIKVLVLSFEPISSSLSNGRTIDNLLASFDRNCVYNFFIHDNPEIGKAHFYCFSDKEAIRVAFFHKAVFNKFDEVGPVDASNSDYSFYEKRSNLKMLLREYVWGNPRIKHLFLREAKKINPDVIFTLLGNGAFLMNLTRYLGKKLKKPIVTFNAEDYYFKNYDYFGQKNKLGLVHRIYKSRFKRSLKKLVSASSKCLYLTDDLKDIYDKEFPDQNSDVIYHASSYTDKEIIKNKNPINKEFIYAGNIADGRIEELEKIGEIIYSINPDYSLHVYTGTQNRSLLDKLESSKFLVNEGFEPYSKLSEIIKKSFAIIHVDGTDPYYSKHTTHGFSTKIADCLASGNCFVVKTSPNSTVYKYLSSHKCAFVCENNESFKKIISSIIRDNNERLKYVNRAIDVAKHYHSLSTNSNRFETIVKEVIENY